MFGWGGRSGEMIFMIGIAAIVLTPLLVAPAVVRVPEKNDFVPAQKNILEGLKIEESRTYVKRVQVLSDSYLRLYGLGADGHTAGGEPGPTREGR